MAEQCHCAVDYSGADCLLYTRHSSKGPNIKRCYIKPPDSCVCTETEKVLQHNSRKCRRARRLISVRTQFDAVSHKLVQHLPWIIYRSRLCLLLRRECRPVHRKHQHVGWEKEEGDGDHFLSLETGSGQDQPVPFYYVIFFHGPLQPPGRHRASGWSRMERLRSSHTTLERNGSSLSGPGSRNAASSDVYPTGERMLTHPCCLLQENREDGGRDTVTLFPETPRWAQMCCF